MSDWIINRLPTDDDADCEGKVWISRISMVDRRDFLDVKLGQAWMPIDEPPPYQPPKPEPSTSLYASIERFAAVEQSQEDKGYLDSDLYYEDQQRIIDAARKVEKLEKELQASVEYHIDYRSKVDRALGQPRFADTPILPSHLMAIDELKDAARKVAGYDNQFLMLRQWCREGTGVETNHVIGKEGWPSTMVGCVVKAFTDAGITPEDLQPNMAIDSLTEPPVDPEWVEVA